MTFGPLGRVLLFAYLAEAGLVLLVAPWTATWDHNFFLGLLGAAGRWLQSPYVRGGVSGIGLVCLAASLAEGVGLVRSLWERLRRR